MDNPLPLILREPLGLGGTGRQVDQEDDAQHARQATLPPGTAIASKESERALKIEQRACDRTHDDGAERPGSET